MRKEISFDSRGHKLVGYLHLPAGQSADSRASTIVMIGPADGSKEHAPSIYAERFARLGYAALAFDHTSYGDSEGTPRCDEDPFVKSEDIKNAVSFLQGRPEVDPDRIVGVGVCAGGGYLPYTAATDRRIKAVATVSAITSPRATIVSGFAGPWQHLMAAAGAARAAYASGGEARYVPFMPDGLQSEWVENGKKFYLTERNLDPDWENRTLLWSYDKLVQFSALDIIDLLTPTPLLVIAGTAAETFDQSQQAYDRAREPKELFLIEGGKHFDFYDRPEFVTPAIEKIDAFFKARLSIVMGDV